MIYQRFLWTLLLLTLLPATLITWLVIPASANVLRVPQDYPTIQDAVDAARAGDTIQVAAATYFENVIVTASVTIVGENAMTTIVDGGGNDVVFDIQADNVELRELTIRNGGRRYSGVIVFYPYSGLVICNTRILDNVVGIVISEVDGNTIEDNIFINNSMYGIDVKYSSSNVIRNNHISESAYGIELSDTSNSQVVNNSVSDTSYGIYLPYSNNNNISANTLTSNSWNIYLTYSNSNIVGNNAVSDGSTGIQVMRSQGNSVFNNTVSSSSYGVYLGYCGANTVTGNMASLNDWGIELYNSSGSTIKENMVKDNAWGFYLAENSKGNYLYHNNIIDNVKQAYRDLTSGQNTWNTPTAPYQGNYWSDYKGKDTNGDGIGDTYLPWQGLDYYPLIVGWGGIHDVAIVNISLSTTSVSPGELVYINVTAANEGTWKETFDVTAKYDSTIIGVKTVSDLAPNANITLTFDWNTTDVDPGDYTIKAEATTLLYETDTADNTYIDGTVAVERIHDVAVIRIKAEPTAASPGEIIYINVTVENQGDFTETFNVTVYADRDKTVIGDEIKVGEQTVYDLSSKANQTLNFEWNTTDVPHGNYWISAEASVVPEETDVSDNILAGGAFVGGIYPRYPAPEVNIFVLLTPLAVVILVVAAFGIVAIFFFKTLMSPKLRFPRFPFKRNFSKISCVHNVNTGKGFFDALEEKLLSY